MKLRKHHFLLKTALTLCLSTMCEHAIAQSEASSLQPAAGWTVSKVGDAGGQNYCTLSRRYENQHVLSFAQSSGGDFSMAVDFQQPLLQADQPYAVNIQPGPSLFRAYETRPITTSAFVIQIGDDAGFLDSLTESKNLKVQINDEKYSYAVTDFASGQNDLFACLEGHGMKNSIARNEKAQEPLPNIEVSSENNGGNKISILDAAPAKISNAFKAQKMTAAPAIPAANVAKEALEVSSDTAQNDSALQAEKIASLNAAPDTRSVRSAPVPFEVSKDKEVEAVASQKTDEPSAQIVSLQKPETKQPSIQEQTTPALSSKDLRKIAAAEALEKENEALRRKNDELLKSLSQSQVARSAENKEEIIQTRQKIADLQAKLKAAKQDNIEMSRRLDSFQLAQEDALIKRADGNLGIEKATQRYNEAEREIQRLGLELEREKTICRAQTREIEKMLFDPALTDSAQMSRLSALEKELEAAQNKAAEIDKIVAEKLEAAMAAERLDMQRDQKAAQDKLASLNGRLSTMAEELEKAREAQNSVVSSETEKIAALNEKIKNLESQLSVERTASAELEAYKKQVAALQAQGSDLRQKNEEMTAQLTELKIQTADFQSNAAGRADRLASLKIENDKLQNQLKLKENEAVTYRAQNQGIQQELSQLRSKLAETQQGRADNEASKIAELQVKTDAMNGKIATIQAEKSVIENQKNSLAKENQALKQEIARFAAIQKEAQQEEKGQNAILVNEIANLKSQIATLRAANNQALAQQGNNSKLEEEIRALRTQIANNEQQETAQIEALKKQNAAFQSSLQSMGAKLAAATEQLNAARASAVSSLTNANSALQKQAKLTQKSAPLNNATKPSSEQKAPQMQDAKEQPIQKVATYGDVMRALLSRSGLSTSGFRPLSNDKKAGQQFAWKDGSLDGFGAVEDGKDFEQSISNFIKQRESACNGDFASALNRAGRNQKSYEIACVSAVQSASSSVLFLNQNGTFVAIAYDSDANNMDVAMDARDRIASSLMRDPVVF